MFQHTISFLNKINYTRKVTLLVGLLSIPLLVTLTILVLEINSDIKFTNKEKIGAEYNKFIMRYLRDVQIYRGSMNGYLIGNHSFDSMIRQKLLELKKDESNIEVFDKNFGDEFKTKQTWSKIKNKMSEIQKSGIQYNPDAHFRKCTEVTALILQLMLRIADYSNLTFDPSVDTYYLIDSMVTEIPNLTEYAGIARGLATGIASNGKLERKERETLIANIQMIRFFYQSFLENTKKAVEVNPSVKESLDSGIKQLDHSLSEFINLLTQQILETDPVKINPTVFFNTATYAIDDGFEINETLFLTLETLLQDKIDRLNQRRILIILPSVTIILVVFYLFLAHFISMVTILNNFLGSSRRLASGELSERIQINRSDEMAVIGNTFNEMANKLEKNFGELRYSEQRMRALLYAIPDIMLRVNIDGMILDYKGIMGSEPELILGNQNGRSIDAVFPQPGSFWTNNIQKAIHENRIQISEFQSISVNQNFFYESRTVMSGFNEAIVIIRNLSWQICQKDLTENKESENTYDRAIIPCTSMDCAESRDTEYVNKIENQILEQSASNPNPCILLCDEFLNSSEQLQIMFNETGLSTTLVHTSREAKAILGSKKFAVLALDVNMPDCDSFLLLREIKTDKTRGDLQIVIISTDKNPNRSSILNNAREIIDWMRKPAEGQRLLEALKQSVATDSYLVPKLIHFEEHDRFLAKILNSKLPQILHVEDDEIISGLVAGLLNGVAETIHAKDNETAMTLLRENHYDLIILDLNLPDGHGFDLLKFMARYKRRQIPVVVFSVDEVNNDMSDDIIASFVKSSASNRMLLQTISQVLGLPHQLSNVNSREIS